MRDIEKDLELCMEATPPPWTIEVKGNTVKSLSIPGVCHGMKPHADDAAFIATAREALPWYIGEVKRLREELEQYQELAQAKAEGRIAPVKCPCDASEEAQELMNAKQEERLVALLPIDTEVFIVQDGEIFGFRIYEYSLLSMNNLNVRYWAECTTDSCEDNLDFWADDIGKSVFLTHEEAKKALEVSADD